MWSCHVFLLLLIPLRTRASSGMASLRRWPSSRLLMLLPLFSILLLLLKLRTCPNVTPTASTFGTARASSCAAAIAPARAWPKHLAAVVPRILLLPINVTFVLRSIVLRITVRPHPKLRHMDVDAEPATINRAEVEGTTSILAAAVDYTRAKSTIHLAYLLNLLPATNVLVMILIERSLTS